MFQSVQGFPFYSGQPHHDAVLIMTPENPLGLFAVECLAHLKCKCLLGHSKFSSTGLERQLQFVLLGLLVCPCIRDPLMRAKQVGDLFRKNLLGFRGGAAEFQLNGISRLLPVVAFGSLGANFERRALGEIPCEFAPPLNNCVIVRATLGAL